MLYVKTKTFGSGSIFCNLKNTKNVILVISAIVIRFPSNLLSSYITWSDEQIVKFRICTNWSDIITVTETYLHPKCYRIDIWFGKIICQAEVFLWKRDDIGYVDRKWPLSVNHFSESHIITVDDIEAQFLAGSTESKSTHFVCRKLFEITSCMREWRHLKFQSLISQLLQAIFMHSLRQWIED